MNGRIEARRLEGPLRIAVWGGAALLILAPAVAMRLGDGMEWSSGDFVLVGAVLLAGCGLFELLMRRTDRWAYRGGALVAVAAAFLTFLAAGAVGLIGSEDEPANALYLAVIALAAAGAAAAAAGANVLAGLAAAVLAADLAGAVLATALFTPMWLLSAWLFGKAARL